MNNILTRYKKKFFETTPAQLFKDILGGVIVALISIPISMGYAQIAGLPMQYGLYGSVFPILLFGVLTSSKDFVFGVDAAPAALVGGVIASMGINAESQDAVSVVPMLTMFVALWLMVFCLFRAGRIVQYISTPVMAGFVTGICCTIILMQTPKLFGGSPGTGEGPELIHHLIEQAENFNVVSFLLGVLTIIIIMLGKKFIPKVPVSALMIAVGAFLTIVMHVDEYGVKLLPHVDRGFGELHIPYAALSEDNFSDYLLNSLSIAAVILAESLLASGGNALKDGYRLDNNREVFAYAAANLSSALCGCCPVNASVSRTGIVRQFGVSSQWLSISAALTMVAVLYFATPIIEYLPVPVLTAIVISALMNACEFHEAKKLWKISRNECYIFLGSFLSVLIFGTIAGVMIGVVLSFAAVVIRAVTPPCAFLGVIRGKDGFYSLERNRESRPVKNTVIYRFGGNLFFANIDTMQHDSESAVTDSTKCSILHAGAVSNIDTAAADRLVMMYEDYRKRNIRFYITEHIGEVNDMLKNYGAEKLLRSGAVRMTTALALRDAGYDYPYETEETPHFMKKRMRMQRRAKTAVRPFQKIRPKHITRTAKGIQPELQWVFGKDSSAYMDRIADELISEFFGTDISQLHIADAEKHTLWGRINYFDEDAIIDRVEIRLGEMLKDDPEKISGLVSLLEERRKLIEEKMLKMDPDILARLRKARRKYADALRKHDPKAYDSMLERRRNYVDSLRSSDPELAALYDEVYGDELRRNFL